ncbi:MAG: VCBS domain-containing protein [Aestuariivirga sp.]
MNNFEAYNIIDGDGSDILDLSQSNRNFSVSGNGGDDTITTFTGNDTITGGTGNDIINGAGGTDTVNFTGPLSNYVIVLNANGTYSVNDTVGSDGMDTLSNIELVKFNGVSYTLSTLVGSSGATFTGTTGNDLANASTGIITGFTGGSLAQLQDSIGDIFNGGAGNDTVVAGSGDDVLNGGIGADTLSGGTGNDTFQFVNGDIVSGDILDGGAGTDTLKVQSGTVSFDLSVASIISVEKLSAGTGNDSINMTIAQFDAFSSIDAGTGTDTLSATLNGTYDLYAGGEPVLTGVENLYFIGGINNDSLTISASLLDASAKIDLGAGTDALVVKNNLASFNWLSLVSPTFSGVENITIDDVAGNANIDVQGSTRSFVINGNAGDDTLSGYSGADTITGGAGNDSLNGGSVTTGGNDTVVFSGPIGNYTVVNLGGSVFTITDNVGTDGTDRIVNFEFVVFGGVTYSINNIGGGAPPLSATFTGTSGNDVANVGGTGTLTGFTGGTIAQLQDGVGDVFYTLAGNDYINAGAGDDIIYASAGIDTIICNDGKDIVYVGTGDFEAGDYITGNAGLDTLIATGTVDFTMGFVDHFGHMSMGDTGTNMSILSSQLFGTGTVTITGGAGNDTLNIVLNATSGPNTNLTRLVSSGIENIRVIDTVGVANSVTGTNYDDLITAAAGNDTVNGGAGNDTVIGGAGNDQIDGGAGANDTTVFSGAVGNYTITNNGTGIYTITDNVGDEGTDTLTNVEFVTFNGVSYTIGDIAGNAAPIGVNDTNSTDPVVEAGGVANGTPGDATAVGNVLSNDTDPNAGDARTLTGARIGTELVGGSFTTVLGATTLVGTYGSLVINTDGSYTYTLNNDAAATQALASGTTATESFSYQLTDGGGLSDIAQLTFTIDGSNDVPAVSASPPAQLVEAGYLVAGTASASAMLTLADVDGTVSYAATALVTAGWTNNGDGTFSQTKTYGTAILDTATNQVTFTLDDSAANSLTPSDHPTQTFTVAVIDNLGAPAFTTVTFTVDGSNDVPAVSRLAISENSIGFVTSDPDSTTLSLASPFASAFGNPAINSGAATTLTLAVQAVAVSGTLRVADGAAQADVIGLYLGTNGNDTANAPNATSPNALYGFGGDDLLTGGIAADFIFGGSGNDTITGGAGADTLSGGGGNDTINIANGNFVAGESIDGGAGTGDAIVLANATAVDFSTGTVTNVETLTGSSGNDTVTLSASQWSALSTINLGTGTNVHNVVASGDIHALGSLAPNNVTTGNLIGTSGDDSITLTGAQLDAIIVGVGTINFGAGTNDTIDLTSTSADFNTLGANNASIKGVEVISAAAAASGVTITLSSQTEGFTIIGSSGADTITGGAGADTIDGAGGNDSLSGGNGNDTLVGRAGADTLDGGSGTDVASYFNDGAVSINLATLLFGGAAAGDSFINIEQFYGSNTGNDTFIGGTGADQFFGWGGNDSFDGGDGRDIIDGGAGNDTLNGAGGQDRLTGGLGNDIFDFNGINGSAAGSAKRDTIVDFEHASDKIDLFDIDANTGTSFNDAFTFIGTAGFTGVGQVRVFQSGTDTIVQVNNGGNTSPEMEIVLAGVNALSIDGLDFIL